MWNSPKTTTQNHQAKFQQKFSEDKKISSLHQSNFDQQITKNGINQNNISDENLIKNAEIIFENNDSIPKLSRQTNIKKTKSPKTIQHHQIKFQQKQKVPTIHQSKFDQQITKNGISNWSGLETRIFHSYLCERFRGYSSLLFRHLCLSLCLHLWCSADS